MTKKIKRRVKLKPKITPATSAKAGVETVVIQIEIPDVDIANALMLRDDITVACRKYAPKADLQVHAALRIGTPHVPKFKKPPPPTA